MSIRIDVGFDFRNKDVHKVEKNVKFEELADFGPVRIDAFEAEKIPPGELLGKNHPTCIKYKRGIKHDYTSIKYRTENGQIDWDKVLRDDIDIFIEKFENMCDDIYNALVEQITCKIYKDYVMQTFQIVESLESIREHTHYADSEIGNTPLTETLQKLKDLLDSSKLPPEDDSEL
ncbi:hypothetical protein O9G_004131 [Rozella allomycis CSF55]|uniref:Uncharacterized protein n=1 Tax=Rozella allomycis (strain CSF55) TaxID=988480 RepID=A0A075AV13_ROZAC|nr:hypothetical protein O9G_004131 [Rozella allomycis CSF55]|eukprot:EPZ32557.1 hypothetical protein O9G_004131 [Rozella allomycis CSF55]